MQKAKVILVKFWLRKAQRDLAVAQTIAADFPDIAIYHCQQGYNEPRQMGQPLNIPSTDRCLTVNAEEGCPICRSFFSGAEKALKGFLILHDLDPGNTHNISTLVQSASVFQPEFKTRLKEAGILSQYNQTYRYPGDPTEDFNPREKTQTLWTALIHTI